MCRLLKLQFVNFILNWYQSINVIYMARPCPCAFIIVYYIDVTAADILWVEAGNANDWYNAKDCRSRFRSKMAACWQFVISKMPNNYCVLKCVNDKSSKFYTFPANSFRRQLWIRNCENFKPDFVLKLNDRLCSVSFNLTWDDHPRFNLWWKQHVLNLLYFHQKMFVCLFYS